MPVTSFSDKPIRTVLFSEMLAALEKVATAHGLKVRRSGAGSYTSTTFSVPFEFMVENGAEIEYKQWAPSYGLAPETFGQEILVNGEMFRITGFMVTRRKFPIVGERVRDNKTMLLTVDGVKAALARKTAATA